MSKLRIHPPQIATFAALANYLAARPKPSFRADWRADSFGEEFIPRMRDWRAGERVLDAGCGFSHLPRRLQKQHGVEAWGADDFGKGPMPYWQRGQDLDGFLAANASVRYVIELLGDPATSTLPQRYFDVVYSKFGIHFSPPPHADLWRHMELLLSDKPGSEIVVLIPHNHVTNGEPASALERLAHVSAREDEVARRLRSGRPLPDAFWVQLQTELVLDKSSPFLYCGYIASTLGISGFMPDETLRARDFCLNPANLVDPPYKGLLDALFSRRASEAGVYDPGRYTPVAYRVERIA
jgi:SAM-dependent methyltransferase